MERLRDRSLLAALPPAAPPAREGRGATPARPRAASRLLSDVFTCHPAHEAVVKMAQRGIFAGYPDGTFQGDREVTQRELAVALDRFTEEVQRLKNGRCYARKKPGVKPAVGRP